MLMHVFRYPRYSFPVFRQHPRFEHVHILLNIICLAEVGAVPVGPGARS